MPVSLRISKCKFFHQQLFALKIFHHFFYRNIVIADGRRLSISHQSKMFKVNNKGGLMCFCSSRNGKWMFERKIECSKLISYPSIRLRGASFRNSKLFLEDVHIRSCQFVIKIEVLHFSEQLRSSPL